MAKFIELETISGETIYLNPISVSVVKKRGADTCTVYLFGSDTQHAIQGTAKEIKDKIEKGDTFYTVNYNDARTSL